MMALMVWTLVGQGGQAPPPTLEDSIKAGILTILPTIEVTATAYRWTYELPPVRDALPRMLEASGVDLVRRGPAFASDLFVEGFRRGDIAVTLDGEHLHNACPNRMDAPVVRINPLEVEASRLVLSSTDLSARFGGLLAVERRQPAGTFTARGYLQAYGAAETGVDAGMTLENHHQGLYARYTQAKPYVDAKGRTFEDLYGYRKTPTAYAIAEGTFRGMWPEKNLVYGVSVASYRDVLFPYLQMDERDNLGGEVFLEVRGHRLYASGFRHLMDNDLRETSDMMFMETDARTWVGGLTDRKTYDLSVRRWIADNTMRMMHDMPMTIQQRMLDLLEARGTVGHTFSGKGFQFQGRLGLAYVERTDNRRDLLDLLTPGARTSRIFPLVGLHATTHWKTARFFLEGATEAPVPEALYIQLKRGKMNNMQQPYWVGNPDLRPAFKGAFRTQVPVPVAPLTLSLEGHASYVVNYVEPTREAADSIPIQTYRNVDAFMTGFRILGQYRFLHLESHYTWAENLTEGKPLSEIPPLHVRLEARPHREMGAWTLTPRLAVVYEARQDRVNPDLKETPTPEWYRVDAGITAVWKTLRLEVGVENLANALYFRHLSYTRNPFAAGTTVWEPGRRITVALWSGL